MVNTVLPELVEGLASLTFMVRQTHYERRRINLQLQVSRLYQQQSEAGGMMNCYRKPRDFIVYGAIYLLSRGLAKRISLDIQVDH